MLGTATLAFALLFAAISLANHKDRDIRQCDILSFVHHSLPLQEIYRCIGRKMGRLTDQLETRSRHRSCAKGQSQLS
uniref:Putative secreted protein n=1 Tax=Ixodes scapularis TaxID=6945 RepID=A0A4D5S0R3_IXOSC